MHIRKTTTDDIITVTRIHRNTIRAVNSKDYIKADIAAWSGRISAQWLREHFDTEQRYVAIIGHDIVGFINLSKNGKELNALYVRQGYIGRGVGSALMKKAEHIIRQSNAKKITIEATITARPFYEKHGFRVLKSMRVELGGRKISVFKMVKNIK